MKNRTMFSELDKYMDRKFLEEHPSIEIYTENQIIELLFLVAIQ